MGQWLSLPVSGILEVYIAQRQTPNYCKIFWALSETVFSATYKLNETCVICGFELFTISVITARPLDLTPGRQIAEDRDQDRLGGLLSQ